MIAIRTEDDLTLIRSACHLAAQAMEIAKNEIQPGVTTLRISEKVREFIEQNGATAAFLGYNGYPGAICVSINEEVVHGIPGDRVLVEGDLVKIDIGTFKDGFYGDMARSYPVGEISPETEALAESAKKAFYEGINNASAGKCVGDIGYAIQSFVEKLDYGVVRALVGHGIGRNLHEDPQVPNYGRRGTGPKLRSGMVLAIEPMITMKRWEVNILDDDWTVVTVDGELSAHYENTCIIRDETPEILTLMDGE